MIFDSEAQKNFILEAVRKYPTNYETALNLANSFGQALQDGRVIVIKEQLKALPMPAPKVPAEVTKDAAPSGNGNGDAKEQAAKAEGGTTVPHDYTKGPAPE